MTRTSLAHPDPRDVPARDAVPDLGGWLVNARHRHPERLHLAGCEHLTGGPGYVPRLRTPTRRELCDLVPCVSCVERALRAGVRL